MLKVIAVIGLMGVATVCGFVSYKREIRKARGAQAWGAVALGAYVLSLWLMG